MMRLGMAVLVALGIAVVLMSWAAAAEPAPSISVGSIIGPWIEIIVLVLGSPIALALVGLIVKLAGLVGFTVEEGRRARLQEIIERGLMLAAQETNRRIDGTLTVDARSDLIVRGAAYTTSYGQQTLKGLRQSPKDLAAVKEIVGARLAEMAPVPATGAERG